MSIFGENAPKYWEKGLSVIPLIPKDKRPFLNQWEQWHDHLPPVDRQEQWISSYPNHNIGLVLGRQSNVTVIDIDAEDPLIQEAILAALPYSPWKRVGQKGCVVAYKFSGLNTFRMEDASGKRIVEYLSTRTQVVLPPSIHPKTQLPYNSNCNLYDVIDELVALPDDIQEILHAKLSLITPMGSRTSNKFRMSQKVSAGARDTQMNRNSGYQATLVLRGEITLLMALSNIRAWVDMNVESVKGDNLDVEKGCQQIIQYILNDVNSKGKILPPGWDEGMSKEEKESWGLVFNDDQEEWTSQQILDYIHKSFTDNPVGDPKRHTTLEFILNKVAKSAKLSNIDLEFIYKALKSGMGISVPTLKKNVLDKQKGPIDGTNHTEIAQEALKYLEKRGFDLRRQNEQFWIWEGTHWKVMPDGEIWKVIAEEFGSLRAASKANDHLGVMKIMSKIIPQKLKLVEVPGINFRNGFLNTDLKLVPHNPDYGMTYVMPFRYDPTQAGKAFKFENLMFSSWGHYPDYQEKKKALQEAMAVTLFGMGPTFQKAILLYGAASAGKSVMLDIVTEMVPPEARCSVTPDQWDQTFTLSFLNQKLLNIVGELHESKKMPGKQFKELVDGTEMSGQFKFKDIFQFKPIATHWFASNHLPHTRDISNGFNRRWLILSFDKPVKENEKIPDLGKMIVNEEIEAVVAWAIEAFPDLMKRGTYTLPSSHHYYADELGQQNSVVRQWMAQRLVEKQGSKIDEHSLFMDYFVFATTRGGGRAAEEKKFCIELSEILSETGKNRHVFVENDKIYMDLALREKKK